MTCAVIDAYGIARFLPAALRRHGVECVHVRSATPDVHLDYRPQDFSVDLAADPDPAVTAALLRAEGVEFVVAGAESGVLLADALSSELGTPGNGMTHPAARRDKFAMVEAVAAAGIPTAASLSSADAERTVAWAAELGEPPVVLKPVASAGTDNVYFCSSAAQIREAHAAILADTDRFGLRNTTVLAQQFLDGAEHFVNTVSRDGVHHVVEIWRYNKRPAPGGRSINDFDYPLDLDDPTARRLAAYVLPVLDALEIRNGAAHTEVMLTARGPVLVECAARLGGAQLPHVISRCLGIDQVDALAQAIAAPHRVLDGTLPAARRLTTLRYVNLISPGAGVVPSGAGWDRLRALPSYLDMVLTIPEGEPVVQTLDLVTSPGYVYLSSDDPRQVAADYRRLRELELDGLYGAHAAAPAPDPAPAAAPVR
ncbi:ATP-grasp domain-containing protein [Kitasatospora nipponensis]|uniref:ATP-grasp domain-containing protein n=1 Tax=Kitasatospora nipponensis TaxID=258049 RepID=A0ABN1WTS5_9ACTN